jgi:WhiB family redox-sensing transcriptional regulator
MSLIERPASSPDTAPIGANDNDLGIAGPIGSLIDWTQFANCKGKTYLFFAPKAERPQARARREAKAKSLCEACLVASECREFARNNREYGYWGGESEEERHVLGYTVAAPIGIRGAKYRTNDVANT